MHRAFAVLLCLGAAAQTRPPELLARDVAAASHVISYGPSALQTGELRLPGGAGPHPVAMLVHGGCWSAKLRSQPDAAVSLALLRPMAAALASAGIASWNVEYKRLGNEGGGWPGTYQDLARAADHLRTLAPKHALDLKRAIVAGHSSGAQLALWVAARHRLPKDSAIYSPDPTRFAGAVALDGPPDLAAFRAIEQRVCGSAVVTEFMGGTPSDHPQRYAQGAAPALLPLGVAQSLLMAPLADPWVANARDYAEQARSKGDEVALTVIEKTGHFDWLNPDHAVWKTVVAEFQRLLK